MTIDALPNATHHPDLPGSGVDGPLSPAGEDDHRSASLAAHVRAGRLPIVPDQLRHILDAREHVAVERRRTPHAETASDVAAQVTAALLAGEQIGDDFDERAARAAAGKGATEARSQMLHNIAQRLDWALPNVVKECLPELLAGLRAELDDLVTHLRAAYAQVPAGMDLDHPDTEQLLEGTEATREAMRSIAARSKRYRRLRNVQLDVLRGTDTLVSHYFPQFDSWLDVKRQGVLDVSRPEEPGIPGEGLPLCASVHAVVSRPDVWLPDIDELADAYAALFGTPSGAALMVGRGWQGARA